MAYKVREMVNLSGRRSQIVSRDHRGTSFLTSIMNYSLLTNPCVTLATTLPEDQIEPYVKNFITGRIVQVMRHLPESRKNLDYAVDLYNKVQFSSKDIRLNPVLSSITEFEMTLSYDIFRMLGIPVFHVWAFSKQDADKLAATGPWTYNEVMLGIGKCKQTKDKVPSNLELSESNVDSTKVRGKGDIEETEQLKEAMIASKLEAGLSVQADAVSSTSAEITETERKYFISILDSIGELGGAFNFQSLSSLQQKLEENMVAILYWNGEFCTICKHNGSIFILVDDNDILVTHPGAVWKTLSIGDQKGIFVDGNFVPTNGDAGLHRCSRSNCMLEFFSKINYRRHCNIHLPASSKFEQASGWNKDSLQILWDQIMPEDAKGVLLHGESVVKGLYGSSFDEIISKWAVSLEFRLTPANVASVLWDLKRLLGGNGKPSSGKLLHILNIASESTFMCNNVLSSKELFEEVLPKSDNTLRNVLACFSLTIEQTLAQRWHDQMVEQMNKTADELLEQEKSQDIKASKDDKRVQKEENIIEDIQIRDKATISPDTSTDPQLDLPAELDVSKVTKHKLLPSDILDWTPLHGEEYFPNFAARNTMLRVHTLFSGEKSIELTRIGRRTAKRLLKFILRCHKSGKCWNGDWNIRDIRVRGRAECIIAKEAEVTASKSGIVADLQRFIEIMAPYYSHEEVEGPPAFFDEFHADAMTAPDPVSEKFVLFQKFMRHHLAFMPPLARSELYCSLFRVCDLLREENHHGYRLLCSKKDAPEWRTEARKHQPYLGVYYYDVDEKDECKDDPYWKNYWDLLRFLRNYVNHAHKHTKVDGVQVIREVIVFDLMIAKDFGDFITELILFLMYNYKMEGSFFTTWDSFQTSDDETEDDDE